MIQERRYDPSHASEDDTFRGFYAHLYEEDKDIYAILLDAGRSREVFDEETAKDSNSALALIIKSLGQRGWIKSNVAAREKLLVVCDYKFAVEHVQPIG